MNLETIMRSFTDEEFDALKRASEAIIEGRDLTPDEDAADLKWWQLGGPAAFERKLAGEKDPPIETRRDVLECFTEAEWDHINGALLAVRDKQPFTPEQETIYGRYLTIGGALVSVPGREKEEKRLIQRYTSAQLVGKLNRPSAA